MTDIIGNLERLQKLKDSGALTEAEFEAQKNVVIGLHLQPEHDPVISQAVISEHELTVHAALKGMMPRLRRNRANG